MSIFTSSSSNEYYTPLWLTSLVKDGLYDGQIDLDPASSHAANRQNVRALEYYTAEDDGLSRPWRGNVFLNPPYGYRGQKSQADDWFRAAIRKYESGEIRSCVLVLKAAVGYQWFHKVYSYPCCFMYNKVHFEALHAPSKNPHGTVVVYLGPDVDRFQQIFQAFGAVMTPTISESI
jgi:hypothetical protein